MHSLCLMSWPSICITYTAEQGAVCLTPSFFYRVSLRLYPLSHSLPRHIQGFAVERTWRRRLTANDENKFGRICHRPLPFPSTYPPPLYALLQLRLFNQSIFLWLANRKVLINKFASSVCRLTWLFSLRLLYSLSLLLSPSLSLSVYHNSHSCWQSFLRKRCRNLLFTFAICLQQFIVRILWASASRC